MGIEVTLFYWVGFLCVLAILLLATFGILTWLYWRLIEFKNDREIWQEAIIVYRNSPEYKKRLEKGANRG